MSVFLSGKRAPHIQTFGDHFVGGNRQFRFRSENSVFCNDLRRYFGLHGTRVGKFQNYALFRNTSV